MTWRLEGNRTPEVLLVEDNEDDVVLTRLAFQRLAWPPRVHHVANGLECLKFLRREPPWTEAPWPDLVLLDLNMPGMSGRATLAAIVADEALRHVPVVVLTTSSREEDVAQMYRLRCSGYVVKPVDLARFFDVIQMVCDYWFSAAILPKRPIVR